MRFIKKSIVSLCLIVSFCANFKVFAANSYNEKEYLAALVDDIKYANYVKANIENDVLKLKIQNVFNKNDCFVKIDGIKVSGKLSKDNYFEVLFSLNDLKDERIYFVDVFFGNKGDEKYYTFLKRDIVISNFNNNWTFFKEENYEKNKKISDNKNYLSYKILPTTDLVKEYSNKIVGNAKSEEEKVAKIYEWIIKNIAYDYDTYDKKFSSYNSPDFVLREKKAVCYGISLTFQALCAAQNIPSVVYRGYSFGQLHAWNEVFVNNKWLVFDCTEDLYFKFKDGKIEETNHNEGVFYHAFMDINSASIDLVYDKEDDLQNNVYTYFNNFSSSDWAKNDILNSIYLKLYNDEQSGNFTRPIKRSEFCELLYYYICKQFYDDFTFNYSQDDLTRIFWNNEEKYYYPFKDDCGKYKPYIYCCYKLGIVNGKTEDKFYPNDYITREEAATMIHRTIDFLDKQGGNFKRSYNENIVFSDNENISDWAKNSISIVSDMGIMNGIGNNCFDPKNLYTIEQTISSLYRLYIYNYHI